MDQGLLLAVALALLIGALLSIAAMTGARRSGRRAHMGSDGVQELEIAVLGGYSPNVVVVREGAPVRLKFTRLDTEECSARVVFSGLKISRHLPPYRTTAVEFLPPAEGEYLFTSDMGMYRGRLVVEAARPRRWLPQPFSPSRRGEPRGTR